MSPHAILVQVIMPELPEVEVVRERTERQCSGRVVSSVVVRDEGVLEDCSAKALASLCIDRRITGVQRHGKQMFIELDRKGFVTVHLGMTGDLEFKERRGEPAKHDRVLFNFKDGSRLTYRDMRKFGAIGCTEGVGHFVALKGLGPDALEVGRQEFASRIRKHDRAIKTVLLDQHVIAGIGNLYADEALFQSRIHPLMSAKGLSDEEVDALFRSVRRVLLASMRVATDFDRLPRSYLLRARESGAQCPRKNGRLSSIRVNGRTSFYCPSCQSIPAVE